MQTNNQERNCVELIRFPSEDAQRRAIRTLLECGMLNFSSSQDEEWSVQTPVAQKLREHGVPFEWLTENT